MAERIQTAEEFASLIARLHYGGCVCENRNECAFCGLLADVKREVGTYSRAILEACCRAVVSKCQQGAGDGLPSEPVKVEPPKPEATSVESVEKPPVQHQQVNRTDGKPWDACSCGWQADCYSWRAHAAAARRRGEIVLTGAKRPELNERLMNELYGVAVAMHESIIADRGAVGWQDERVNQLVQAYGDARAEQAVREEREEEG